MSITVEEIKNTKKQIEKKLAGILKKEIDEFQELTGILPESLYVEYEKVRVIMGSEFPEIRVKIGIEI